MVLLECLHRNPFLDYNSGFLVLAATAREGLVFHQQNLDSGIDFHLYYMQGPQQFRQYNQQRFGGNYRGGNQNYRSPNRRQYDNRSNSQKPYYNNRNVSYGNSNEGPNYQRNRYNPDQRNDNFAGRPDYRSFNNQTPRRFNNSRFDPQQTPTRSQGYSNRPQQTFSGQRRYGNNFRRFQNNQNQELYPDQQVEEGANFEYEAEGDYSGMNETETPSNYSSYKQDSYSGYKNPRPNASANFQQGFTQRKLNTEDSIFGKAKMNLVNASYSKGNNSDL